MEPVIFEAPTLKDYLHILRRRRNIAIIFFLMVVLAVTVGSFLMQPVYQATATLMIDVESPNVLTTTGSVELASSNYYSYKEYFQSQMEILASQPILEEVFNEFNLKDTPDYAGAREPIKKFSKTILVEPVRDTRLLKLNVDNPDPALAAKIANRIADIYVKRNLVYISKNELLNLLKNEYLKLDSKLSEYSKIYKDGHPEMIRLKKEMAELVDKMDEEKKRASNYSDIKEIAREDYTSALEGLKANNISIVSGAEAPVVPIKPRKTLNIAIAIVIGLFGGVGLAFFFEYMDDTVKEIEDIERITNWPFLGNVPVIDTDSRMTERDKGVFVELKPKDPIAEAYRSFRTHVFFSSTDEHPLKSVLITSLGPGEGKTTTLSNLGIAIAQNQKKVLMVDADMRKPQLHNVFQKENRKGLSAFLIGQASFDDVIQKTEVENLFLVNSGAIPPNPSELIDSHKMKEFLSKAKAGFDFVLLDSPPIAVLTDAAILSRVVDGIIIVTESGKTSRKALLHSYKIIKEIGARVVGIFLNKISINTHNYYYYSYYYYGKKEKK